MNRLTNEFVLSNIENGFHLDDEHIKFVKDKLEYADKMKSIEQDLGCPLDVLFKLGELEKNGEAIVIKGETPSEFETFETDNFQVDFSHKRIIVFVEKTDWTDTRVFYFKDYKKTWWLSETKED